MRKGDMPLEMVFKFFLYIVVVLIVITLIVSFRNEIVKFLKMCNWLPQACEEEKKCNTVVSTEGSIDKTILDKYCNRCWKNTGELDFSSSCICYIVQGDFSPIAYKSDNCELKCDKRVTSIRFTYDHLLKKINIEC